MNHISESIAILKNGTLSRKKEIYYALRWEGYGANKRLISLLISKLIELNATLYHVDILLEHILTTFGRTYYTQILHKHFKIFEQLGYFNILKLSIFEQ